MDHDEDKLNNFLRHVMEKRLVLDGTVTNDPGKIKVNEKCLMFMSGTTILHRFLSVLHAKRFVTHSTNTKYIQHVPIYTNACLLQFHINITIAIYSYIHYLSEVDMDKLTKVRVISMQYLSRIRCHLRNFSFISHIAKPQ